MLFLYPMWDSESQRMGMKKCTLPGYAFHEAARLLGFGGFLVFSGAIIKLGSKCISRKIEGSDLWFIAIAFGIGIVSETLYQISRLLAARKGFNYDVDKCEASWDQDGKRVTFKTV